MKIARFAGPSGRPVWGTVDEAEAQVRVLAKPFSEWAGQICHGLGELLEYSGEAFNLDAVRLLAPLEPGSRIFGLGMNYITHLTRLGHKEAPAHPVAFLKTDSAIVDPDGEIRYPPVTRKLDYEVELVAIVGRPLEDADDDATACLLGYTIGNDISARDAGKLNGRSDLFGQKTNDLTAPVGPWITTIDEIGHGQPELELRLWVNGEQRQEDNTRNMVFSMEEMLNYVDIRIALRPGDILFTGTTFGVGLEDGRLLEPGDLVENEIEKIGTLRNRIGPKTMPSPNRLKGRIGMPA